MSRLLWSVGGLLAAGVIGLSMLFWALERTVLVSYAAGADANPPLRIYVLLFVGLSISSIAGFFALLRWSRYLRDHPGTPQAPVWLLVIVGGLAVAALVTASATHAAYIRSLSVVPVDPNQGYIAFQASMGAVIGICLVLLGARWAPGYKHVPA